MPNISKNYVNGDWITPSSAASMNVINPANEEVLGRITLSNARDVDVAVAAAKEAFEAWSLTGLEERVALLEKLADLTEKRMEEMARAVRLDMGAPLVLARQEQADAPLGHLRAFIADVKTQSVRETLPTGDVVTREPIGVCGLITPWNWPLSLIALKVIPAIAAGCTVVLKPSEYAPFSSVIYAELMHAAGFPAGVFNMVQGDGPTAGDALSRHPDVAMISFTGSTRAGVAVQKAAADTVKRVTLELGGKGPNIIFDDCDLRERIGYSVRQCFKNTGQSCDAPTRLIVERSAYDKALEIAKEVAANTVSGDPADPATTIGPLVNAIQFDRVQALIQAGIDEGATLLCGGPGRPEGMDKGYYVRPTIYVDVTSDMKIAREEIFGPVLVIMPFDGEDEAVAIANDTPYGLASYIQSGDRSRIERVARRLRAGIIRINGGGPNYGCPVGGFKMSGNGREGGLPGLQEYQEIKTLHFG